MTSNEQFPRVLAITACPTGIAHTYMAAENLEAAAQEMGINLKVETHGSIGVEGNFSSEDIEKADAVLIAADTVIEKDRFAGKPLLSTGVDAAIKNPKDLLTRAQTAPVYQVSGADKSAVDTGGGSGSIGKQMYQALMNGVSHMIPFVVTGGLLLAISLSIGGQPSAEGLIIPEGTFWFTLSQIGVLAFSVMVPVLSAYIAAGIAGRPGLTPGFVTGLIAVNGSLYGSEAGAGFIGGILTGFLSGYVALAIRKIPVNKYIVAIWPIIVIPIFTTVIVGLAFVYLLGNPISTLFEGLTQWLASLDGTSVVVLGAILGAMIAFDMGGPFNKTAFLFGGGMIASGNAAPMGMVAAAIAVPPLAVGLATLLRRSLFTSSERESGIASLLMGFFGITEGAIPLAAARPLQVIPANLAGGAVAGALAGMWGVKDNVMHGGPIVAVLGAVDGALWFFLALLAGVAVTTALILLLVGVTGRRREVTAPVAAPQASESVADEPVRNEPVAPEAAPHAPVASGKASAPVVAQAPVASQEPAPSDSQAPLAEATEPTVGAGELIGSDLVLLDEAGLGQDRDAVIAHLVEAVAQQGRVANTQSVIDAALIREGQTSTAVGHQVAIPHARTADVLEPTLAFARLGTPGVEWNSPDQAPVRLVFLIAVPEKSGNAHLKILSSLSRALMHADFRDSLLVARDKEEALGVIDKVLKS